MLVILLMIMFILFLVIMLMLLSFFLSFKSTYSREKLTPFECGFDPIKMNRVSFCVSYYLFSLIFLVFDVEIILLIPMILILKMMLLSFSIFFTLFYFIFILVLGVLIEWLDSSFSWSV